MPNTVAGNAAEIQRLTDAVEDLQDIVRQQQELIDRLQTEGNGHAERASNPLQGLKAPPIPVFTGKSQDCTSVKVKSFIFSVRRMGCLSNTQNDMQLVQLATCHLQERAALWISRIESTPDMPQTLAELQSAMMK